MRLLKQCPNCAAYEANWTKEIMEEMNEQRPHEEVCTLGMDVWVSDKCPEWVGCDED